MRTPRMRPLPPGWWLALALALASLHALSGCGDDDGHPVVPGGGSCLDCHGDEARLRATANPDDSEPPEDSGEG